MLLGLMAQPSLELITMSPGDPLYTRWGHAAIRVADPSQNLDLVYNFGSIDLGPNFWRDTLRGQVHAFVAVSRYAPTLAAYAQEERTITRRVLRIPKSATASIAQALASLAGTRYVYHHLEDNCSTRAADVLDQALGGALSANGARVLPETFRSVALTPLRDAPWLYVAVDIALAGAADRPLTQWQARFVPSELATWIDTLSFNELPLVSFASDVHRGKNNDTTPWSWPWLTAYLLVGIPLLALGHKRPRVLLFLWTPLASVVGAAVLVLWLGSRYDFLQANANVLVFPPTHALSLFWPRRGYFGAHAILLSILTIFYAANIVAQNILPMIGWSLPLSLLLAWKLDGRPASS